MNNLILKIKKMLLNRNTVTILGVIAGVIALWFVYSATLNKAISPQKVPVATKELTAGTIITKDDIEYVEINSDVLKKAKVVTKSSALIGYYVTNGTSIQPGAMFYRDQVVDKEHLIERDRETIPDGYSEFWLKVDNTSTYANSIYPGDKIDLWIKTQMEGNVVYEEFITSIEVLSVKDSKGKNIFDEATGKRTPAWLSFAVDQDMLQILSNIKNLSQLTLYPVPRNKMYTEENAEPEIVNKAILTYIDSLVRPITNNTTTTDNNRPTGTTE